MDDTLEFIYFLTKAVDSILLTFLLIFILYFSGSGVWACVARMIGRCSTVELYFQAYVNF